MLVNASVKDTLRDLLERLPEDATWDDVDYAIHLRRRIERGMDDISAGKTIGHADILREFGIDPEPDAPAA